MTTRTIRRFGAAIAVAGLMAGGIAPAFAYTTHTNIDGNANETLNAIANMVDANDIQAALDLTNWLRYNCIRAIEVNGNVIPLVALERHIAAPNPDVLVLVANRAEEVGPATFKRMSMIDCPANSGHNSSDGSGPPPPDTPPPSTEPPD